MTLETQKTLKTCSKGNKGETRNSFGEGAMHGLTKQPSQCPNFNKNLLEEVLDRNNLKAALKRVTKNKGSAGVDGMTTEELPQYLKANWPKIKEELLESTYTPMPVKRVEIPKPNGETRKLGIPTVLDRFIQQALAQVLQRGYDASFSENCFGFRPGRSAHQAIRKAQSIQNSGYQVVVDLDLEKFFDRVNHDKLMGKIARGVKDKRVLKLIRSCLNAGVMENGVVMNLGVGTPQGGPLSPLLSNIILDDLDKELERRGHRFVRYGDDCNIYVKTFRSGERVMKSISSFIETKLKLVINQQKSAVRDPWEVKFLGFTFSKEGTKIWIHDKSVKRFKDKIRILTRGPRRISMRQLVSELKKLIVGWRGYFGISERKHVLKYLDGWIRRRLRCYIWQQWQSFQAKKKGLLKLGVSRQWAIVTAASSRGDWWCANTRALRDAFSVKYFDRLAIPRLYK